MMSQIVQVQHSLSRTDEMIFRIRWKEIFLLKVLPELSMLVHAGTSSGLNLCVFCSAVLLFGISIEQWRLKAMQFFVS